MLTFTKEGPRLCKLSQQQLFLLSNNLENIKSKLHSDFARQSRRLDEPKKVESGKFHQFLLYNKSVFFKDVLSQKSFEHFSLSVCIRIMIAHYKNEKLPEYSKELLSWFVKNAGHFYGPYFTVYNVQKLIYLHDDVNYHKMSLFDVSAFAFENYMQTLKCYVRKSTGLVVQVVNRRCEIDKTNSDKVKKDLSTKLSVNERDRCFLIKGSFIFVDEIQDNNMLYCGILPITKSESLKKPWDSKILDICKASSTSPFKSKMIDKDSILKKVMCITNKNDYIFLPFVSCVKWD